VQVEVCVQDGGDAVTEAQSCDDGSSTASSLGGVIAMEMWERWFQVWLEALQPTLSPIDAYELSLRLTDDREIQSFNQQYRQQDKPTDVLAFAALESLHPQPHELQSTLPLYLGDIVISIDTAQRQADAQQHSLTVELAWLAAHGLLHLLGWDHPDDESLSRMLKQQQDLLQIVGVHSKTG